MVEMVTGQRTNAMGAQEFILVQQVSEHALEFARKRVLLAYQMSLRRG